MLAYVFWHWKQPQVPAVEYETRQRAFHAALGAAPPEGFARSVSVAVTGAPWANDGGEAYEDWYLVRGSADLDPLNDAAVTASRSAPHDAAAAVVAGGAAGLYRLRMGAALESPSVAHWFAKPAALSYAALWTLLAPLVEQSSAALWMRHMVLGPSPEFCLHARSELTLPPALEGLVLSLRRVCPLQESGSV